MARGSRPARARRASAGGKPGVGPQPLHKATEFRPDWNARRAEKAEQLRLVEREIDLMRRLEDEARAAATR